MLHLHLSIKLDMRKIIFGISLLMMVWFAKAQEKTDAKAPQWAMIPNYSTKGDNGLLIINLPAPAAMNFTVVKPGDPRIIYTWHSSTSKELPAGNYEVTFWNIRIPVTITKQNETRVYAGVLNSTVKKPWEVWTMDSTKVFGAGSAKMVALPAGRYIIKTSGTEIKTTIRDGQVSIFSFAGY